MVLNDLDGSQALATAATTPDPDGRAHGARRLRRTVEGAVFADRFRLSETRGYVKNVMSNATTTRRCSTISRIAQGRAWERLTPKGFTPTDLP